MLRQSDHLTWIVQAIEYYHARSSCMSCIRNEITRTLTGGGSVAGYVSRDARRVALVPQTTLSSISRRVAINRF